MDFDRGLRPHTHLCSTSTVWMSEVYNASFATAALSGFQSSNFCDSYFPFLTEEQVPDNALKSKEMSWTLTYYFTPGTVSSDLWCKCGKSYKHCCCRTLCEPQLSTADTQKTGSNVRGFKVKNLFFLPCCLWERSLCQKNQVPRSKDLTFPLLR